MYPEKLPQWRRTEIQNTVLLTLEATGIRRLPVTLSVILNGLQIPCISYEKAGIDFSKRQKDGFSLLFGNSDNEKRVIVYNSKCSHARMRWTFAHEIGHIALHHDHRARFNPEAEANYFSRVLLSPLAVLDKLGARHPEQIMRVCKISHDAAEIRAGDFERRQAYVNRHGNTFNDLRFIRAFSVMFDEESVADEQYVA